MSAKRNMGVNNSDTEYVAFIDSDAYPKKNWLETAIEFLQNNEKYAAVTGCQLLPPDDSFQRECLRIVRYSLPFTYPEFTKCNNTHVKEQDCGEFMTVNVVMKKNKYISLGGMNENVYLAEDSEFSKRIICAGDKIRFIPDVQVYHHEEAFFPFMRKIFCSGNYFSNTLIHKKGFQGLRKYIIMFLPLFIIILFMILFFKSFRIINFVYLLTGFMIIMLGLFTFLSLKFCRELNKNKIKGFFLFILIFIAFCTSFISGQISGLLNLKFINVHNLYRHY